MAGQHSEWVEPGVKNAGRVHAGMREGDGVGIGLRNGG